MTTLSIMALLAFSSLLLVATPAASNEANASSSLNVTVPSSAHSTNSSGSGGRALASSSSGLPHLKNVPLDNIASAKDQQLAGKGSAPPLFELGIGFFALRLNHYRGSNQYANHLWPLPFFIYRGEKVHAKNSMIMGNLYEKNDFKMGISMMASLRVSSTENQARQGMPSLDPTIELGPEFEWTLLRRSGGHNTFSFVIPIREAIAVEFFRAKGVGQFTVPYLSFAARPSENTFGFFTETTLAVMFASQGYHDYFYGVPPAYARSDRPAYRGKAGYSGMHASWFLSRKLGRFYLYAFARHDRLEGAAFEDSPLVKQKHYWVTGGGIIWYFFQSTARGHEYNKQ
ncbi:MAG: MipA/OmpV family protein [Oligoflexia bacterium]|nr:MipA/OmpV family protein [Oligoflexia bacterium]MBF0364856.1 MipA/OmpV family protein [Oligoflexia bacterium]